MNFHNPIVQIQREFFFFLPNSSRLPSVLMLNIWGFFLRKEVTSSVCTSAAILTTIIRLFVRRLIFWFDDVSCLFSVFEDQLICSLEKLLVN